MAGKRKISKSEEHFGRKSKRTKVDKTNRADVVTTVFDNPGFSHVAQEIFSNLEHNEQLKCRLVCKSWKTHLDQPVFWIKKLNNLGQSKKLFNSWTALLPRIEKGSFLEQETINCLRKSHKHNHVIMYHEGIDLIHIVAMFGSIKLMKLIESYIDHDSKTDKGWTPIHIAAINGQIDIVKYFASKVENLNAPIHDGRTTIHLAARY